MIADIFLVFSYKPKIKQIIILFNYIAALLHYNIICYETICARSVGLLEHSVPDGFGSHGNEVEDVLAINKSKSVTSTSSGVNAPGRSTRGVKLAISASPA